MKKLNLKNCLIWGLIGVLFTSCEIINPDEKIPSYLHISEINVVPTQGLDHGSLSSKITNANIFIDDPISGVNESIGVVSLPATIPILLEGEFEINVEPVIKANGNSFSLEAYPYYETIEFTRTLTPAKIDSVSLETSYQPNVTFVFIEDFEAGGPDYFTRSLEATSPNEILATEIDALEGKSGVIKLDENNAGFIISTGQFFPIDLTQTGKVYLEIDYKTDIPLQFGIIGIDGVGQENPVFEFGILEKEEWNKIYLNLTELIQFVSDDNFFIAVRGVIPLDSNAQLTLESAEVRFDNIKLVHR